MEDQLQPILMKIQTSIEVLSSRIEIVEKVISDKVQNTSDLTEGHNVSSPNQQAQASDVQNQPSTIAQENASDSTQEYFNQLMQDESTNHIEDIVSRSIQRKCDVIKDRLAKISLPNHMKLNENSAGIKQESKPVLKLMSRAARLTETALKQLTVVSLSRELPDKSFKLSAEDVDILFTLLGGVMNFLQSEYTNLIERKHF